MEAGWERRSPRRECCHVLPPLRATRRGAGLSTCTPGLPLQAVDAGKEREELFEDWVDEKEKQVGRVVWRLRAGPCARRAAAYRSAACRPARPGARRKGGCRPGRAISLRGSHAWGASHAWVRWLALGARAQEKEARRAETKRRRGAFRELLERSKHVRHDTAWRKAQDRLAGEAAVPWGRAASWPASARQQALGLGCTQCLHGTALHCCHAPTGGRAGRSSAPTPPLLRCWWGSYAAGLALLDCGSAGDTVGEPEFEALDKLDRLEVFEEYIRYRRRYRHTRSAAPVVRLLICIGGCKQGRHCMVPGLRGFAE